MRRGEPVRITALILSLFGAIAAGALGLSWLQDAARFEREAALAQAVGLDPSRLVIASYMLVGTLVLGCVAGVFILQGRHRLACTLCLAAGIAPGMLEPKAFVVTFLLILAGFLAYGSATEPPLRRIYAGQSTR
jgi:hypothetical protein